MKIKQIMSKNVATITKGCLIREAAEIMKEKDISCLVVTCGDVIEGIVTERDVLRKIVANQKMFNQIQVSDIMSAPIITIDEETNIHDAVNLMQKKHIRRIVIVKNGAMTGIATESDFVEILKNVKI